MSDSSPPILEYQSATLDKVERKARSIARALNLFGWGLIALTVITALTMLLLANASSSQMAFPCVVMLVAGAACLATRIAIRRRAVMIVGVASAIVWLVGIAFATITTYSFVVETGPVEEEWLFVAIIGAVFLPILIGIFALAWGLAQMARVFAREKRESRTQFLGK